MTLLITAVNERMEEAPIGQKTDNANIDLELKEEERGFAPEVSSNDRRILWRETKNRTNGVRLSTERTKYAAS